MLAELDSEQREIVTVLFVDFAQAHDLSVLETGIDNHGGFQWTAAAVDGLNRYITLALTPQATAACTFAAEVWVAADDDRRFTTRRTVWSHNVTLSQLVTAKVSAPDERRRGVTHEAALGKQFITGLERGLQELRTISTADLDQEYIVPRGTSRQR